MDDRKNTKGARNKGREDTVGNGVSRQNDTTINCRAHVSPKNRKKKKSVMDHEKKGREGGKKR